MLNFLIGSACLLGGTVCLAATGLIVIMAIEYVKAYKQERK